MLTLFTAKRCGGEIVEFLLEDSGLEYKPEFLDYEKLPGNSEYAAINFMKQVPALRLPGGEVMTESLAIAHYINHVAHMHLAPGDSPQFWRWSVFLVGSVYPTFTYADDTSRWTDDAKAQESMRTRIREWRKQMWLQVEKACEAPYFLGDKKSLVDYYLAVMTFWGPGEEWFRDNTPKIMAVAERMRETSTFKKVDARNI
jgi:GST-like protein